MVRLFFRNCAVILCLSGVASIATAQPAPPVVALPQGAEVQGGAPTQIPTAIDNSAAEYMLGPEDVIEVEIVGQPDRLRARVYTDGTVQLNLVGKLTASGKTPRELGAEIATALKSGGFYANPVVNIEVTNYASRYVTVLGAVSSPSLVPINRTYRLSEILARVGGVQATAADYLIVRPENGPEKRFLIEELATGDAAKDPFVTPGDKIFAPVAEVFYISGQVNAPGPFPMRSDLTVRQAIARAGGLTAAGSDKKVEVNRSGKKIKLKGDDKVEPGDVLVVGERLF
jgi:polysaccharide export outer membrane protein